MNFLRRLALQTKKNKLDDSSRLAVVEIMRVPEHASELVSFLVGLRTYQYPGYISTAITRFIMLARNYKVQRGGGVQWHEVRTKFRGKWSSCS